jgi:surface antigen
MNRKVLAAVGVVCALIAGQEARAQWLGPAWETTTVLTGQDLDMMRATVQRDIHGKPVAANASWQNPASGNSGTITLLKKLTHNGKPCEQIQYVIRTTQPTGHAERYVFTSCHQPDGSWKLES